MGEKRVPVEDEVERALQSMRAGFLLGSQKIAAGAAQLEQHLANAPVEESASVRAALAQIVGTQARLRAKMEGLRGRSWDTFKAMVSLVKAQQTVLDQVGHLVKEHVLPRQLENLSAIPLPAGPPSARRPAPPPPRPRQRAERSVRARDTYQDEDDEERRSLFSVMREWSAGFKGLAAMIVAAVILSSVPRDVKLQDLAAKLMGTVGAGSETAARDETDATVEPERSPASPPPAPAPRSAERVPSLPSVAAVPERPPPAVAAPPASQKRPASAAPPPAAAATGRAAPAATPPPAQKRPTAPAPPPPAPAAAVAERPDPPALPPPAEKLAAAPATGGEPTAPPANAPEEQFVPVVFTHKDHDKVMQAMAELKERYPGLLLDRKGEVQPVDLGKKGIWHRLVFLPAGPRPEATKLCDRLMAEGYDRCWVKAY